MTVNSQLIFALPYFTNTQPKKFLITPDLKCHLIVDC